MAKNKKQRTKKEQIPAKPKAKKVARGILHPDWWSFKSNVLPILVITLIGFGLYFQSITYEYVLDDTMVIVENNFTKKGVSGIWEILSTDSFQGYFGEQKDLVQGARYRPLSIVTFALEYALFGLNPKVSHFINILLYIICCLLIFRTLHYIIPAIKYPWYLQFTFFIAILFLVHPLHVEAVANIKGRDEIMAMIGSIGALLMAFKYQDKNSYQNLILLALYFTFALFSKESSLTFLGVIPIALYIRRGSLKKPNLIVFATILLLAIGYIAVRYQIIGFLYDSGAVYRDLMNNPFLEMNVSEKYATIMYTFGQYVKLCLFPHPLTHDYYPYHIPIMKWTDPGTLISLFIFLGFIFASIFTIIKKQWVGFGALYFLLTISIVSNAFVNVGTFMNERFAFMPSLGFIILLFHLLNRLRFKSKSILISAIAGILFFGYSFKTLDRLPAWKDTYSLNATAIKVSKNSARINSFMATAIYNKVKGMNDRGEKISLLMDALQYARKAIDIYPTYYNGHLMLGGVSAELFNLNGDLNSLLNDFTTVGTVRPDIGFITEYCNYLNDRTGIDQNKLIDFYYDLGYNKLFVQKRNAKWAMHYLKLGKSISPDDTRINQAIREVYPYLTN